MEEDYRVLIPLKKGVFMFNLLVVILSFFTPSWEKVPPDLQEKLRRSSEDEVLTVIVLMNLFPDYEYLKTIPDIKTRADYLKLLASESQREILNFLSQKSTSDVVLYESYWVYNGIRLKAKPNVIKEILRRDDVLRVELEPEVFLIKPEKVDNTLNPEPLAAPWNMQMVGADSAWANGFRGEGVIIGSMDSGVDRTHPAFSGVTFKGRDFTSDGNPFSDGCQHGTHTTGTAIGGTGNFGPNDIGVAPNVPIFVMAKIFDDSCYAGNISGGFQWIASLKADSGLNIRAVNNSWGSCTRTSLAYWSAIQTWRSLEIFPVFAIGNNANCYTSCTSTGTAGTPGNYPIVIGVGTVGSGACHDCVGQRGPAPNQSPWNDPANWFYPTWNLLKPDIAAPGSGVRSSVPGGGYATWDGSSMATPHITGALALIFQANPTLTVDSAYSLLVNTTSKPNNCGYSYPNDRVGWGIVNVWHAIKTQLGQPVVTIVSWDTSGTGSVWDPGETVIIDFVAKNVGQDTALTLTGKLRTTSPYVTVVDSLGAWPDLVPNQSAPNTDNFSVYADPGAPIGTNVNFVLYIYGYDDNGNPKTWPYYFSLQIGQLGSTTFDIPAGNAILTVSNKGGFPSADAGGSIGPGTGFKWPKTGANHLYYGSFAIGNSSTYVVDAFYNASDGFDSDFAPRDGLWWVSPFVGDTMARSGYDDLSHASPKNIYVTQYAFAFSQTGNPGCGNGVLVELDLINKGSNQVSGVYAGLFMDFDINPYNQNQGNKDLTRKLIYMYYGSTYVGVSLLESQANFIGKFLHNPTYVYPTGRPTETDKYQFLAGQIGNDQTSAADDWTIVASSGPFTLDPNDTQRVVFAIVGGSSLTNLQQNVDAIINCYSTLVKETKVNLKKVLFLKAERNPKGINIIYSLPYNSKITLDIVDVAGRIIKNIEKGERNTGLYFVNLKKEEVGKGVFFLRLKTDKESRVVKFLNY
ncbi:MAG: S8 family peptidase [candidate division WOR-3 bacterium]